MKCVMATDQSTGVLSSGDAYWLLRGLSDPSSRDTDLRFKEWLLSKEVALSISRGMKTLDGIEKNHRREGVSVADSVFLGLVNSQVAFERGVIAQVKDLVILAQSQGKISIHDMKVTYENLGELMQRFEDDHARMFGNFGSAVEHGNVRGSRQENPGWKVLEEYENYGCEMGGLVDTLHGRIQDAALRAHDKELSNGPAKSRAKVERDGNVVSISFGGDVEPTTVEMLQQRAATGGAGRGLGRGLGDFDGPSPA